MSRWPVHGVVRVAVTGEIRAWVSRDVASTTKFSAILSDRPSAFARLKPAR
jgi:hypothetical protein